MRGEDPPSLQFAQRAVIASAIAAATALCLLFVWFTGDLLLLVFAAVLVSILLRGLSRALRERTGLGRGWSLLATCLLLIVLLGGIVWLVSGQLASQVSDLQQQLPRAIEQITGRIERYGWGREALSALPNPGEWLSRSGGSVVSRFTGIASSTLGFIVNVALVGIIGLYLASQPDLYARGLVRMVPIPHRSRAAEILEEIDGALWRWLIGRFFLMFLNTALTSIGLWLLGIPFFLTLGLLAGLLNFIPNIGPWIAAIPALLIGLLQGPWQGLYVLLLYLVLQSVDGYVLTPLVDRRSVKLPPVLTITAQVLLGAAFGFVGLLLASPLLLTIMIVVIMVYVEDALGDREGGGPVS